MPAMKPDACALWWLGLAAWLCSAGLPVRAVEVWMPETGEVALEEPVAHSVESRRRHAYALIGTGHWKSGIGQLDSLLEENPDAPWAGEAGLLIGRALLGAGRDEKAFEHLAALGEGGADPQVAAQARALQCEAAQRAAANDFGDGMALFDRLIESARNESDAEDAMRLKADAALQAGRFLYAQDQYRALVSLHPHSQWVPYCWFKIADCEWRMAQWLGLGMEGVRQAERSFSDFADIYPGHAYADEARQKAADAREQLARMNAAVARFYIHAEKRPWAAVPYLRRVTSRFPESSEAEWAARQLDRVEAQLAAPLPGDLRDMPLPGVNPARQTPGASSP